VSIRWPWEAWIDIPVLVDEGGIRHTAEGIRRYIPFVRISNAVPLPQVLARDLLAIITTEGERVEVETPIGANEAKLATAILECARMARATQAAATARRGDLASFIAMVGASHAAHRQGLAYRACSVEPEELERIFADPSEENEARAAAAHALIAMGRTESVAPLIGRRTPPLVVAAVRLASKNTSIVSNDLLEVILPFLEIRDRVVFGQRMRSQPEAP
jgi:hypothetical protein